MGVLEPQSFSTCHVLEAVLWILNRVRNGTCCRKAIRTTKLCIDAFKKFCAADEILRRVLTDVAKMSFATKVLDEEECFIDATFVMAKGGGSEIGPTKRGKRHENHGDCGSPWVAALGQHACGAPS